METRAYTQTARAESTERTRTAIHEAARSLFAEGDYDFSLERIATRAGVTVRTILRHFGSKEGLVEESLRRASDEVMATRSAPPGDVETAVARLVDHYEEMGDEVLGLLAIADRYPIVRRITDAGRALHRQWVEGVFAPDLEALPPAERRRRRATLAALTDVHVWALLRHDHGLGRAATEAAIRRFVEHERGTRS